MPEKSQYIQDVRLKAMFKAVDSGIIAPTDLINAADEAETATATRIGNRKEQAFNQKVRRYFPWLIESLKPSTTQENHDGVDWWVIFRKNNRFPLLGGKIIPAQIKSSPKEVENFRNCFEYIHNFGKKIIVIDFNLRISENNFRRKFTSELHRIEDIIKSEKYKR